MEIFKTNPAILRRWAAQSDTPLPASFQEFRDTYPSESFRIEKADPELCLLLSGKAGAGLVAQVLTGEWSDQAPDPVALQQQAIRDEIQSLYDSKPFGGKNSQGEIIEPSITNQMRLAALDPAIAKRCKDEALNVFKPEKPELADAVRAAELAEERRAISESHEYGQTLARRQYPAVRRAQIMRELRDQQQQARLNSRNGGK